MFLRYISKRQNLNFSNSNPSNPNYNFNTILNPHLNSNHRPIILLLATNSNLTLTTGECGLNRWTGPVKPPQLHVHS